MRRLIFFALIFIILPFTFHALAQDIPAKPTLLKTGTFIGVSKPLRDIPPMSKEDFLQLQAKAQRRAKNTPFQPPVYPFAATSLPKGPDAVWQQTNGTREGTPRAPIQYWEGQSSPYYPPDCNGATGPNHYMQTVNTTYAIYSKTGTLLAGPTNMNLLFGSVTGANYNDGDPLVLYDEQADRFLAVEFSVSGSNDYMLMAVSTTGDPTGTWYQYSFDLVDMPDYEKVAVWRDGYYMGTNTQPATGNDIYVFERSQMLVGGTARMVAFDNPYRPGTGVVVVPPVDNDGTFAPEGSPGTFIAFNDDGIGGGSDQLWLYELAVNWTTPASSTFNRTQQINVTSFDSQFNNWEDIAQPGTTRKLCAISTVIMNVPQYRNFGTYQSIVCCHTVDVDGTDHAGVRWYELRKTPPATTWTLRQQGTYAPDAHSRWMGAIAMNGSNKIAIGYSLSSSTQYPGIRYAGQSSAAYAAATGVLDVPEVTVLTGTNYQSTYNRWGDYASMSIDPSDDQTFWFTTEYIGASEARKTKIFSFVIGNAPLATTLPPTSITGTTATLNGTVNPNGLATNYNFEWGLTTSYGNTTTVTSAGSGTSGVSVNAAITGLTVNQTYHCRLVAVNSDGTSYGTDLAFIAGGATLTTTAASSIGLTSATSGGNITADGGSAVTARGVCWSTSANPTVTGDHTTDGSGLGTFTSSITGLSSSTLYHIRAYATTGNGTYYGDDKTFTTLCGIYTLPFTESFSGTTIPTCWSQVDNQGNGQVWQFGTITGQSPNPALTGNYAYLNSDAYGSSSSQNADLVSPTLNLTDFTNVTLQFNHYFKSYTGSSGTLSYSINNGSTWTTIATFTATSSANPTAFSQVISAVAGQATVKFKWNYTGTYGYYWGVDDVSVTGTMTGLPVVTTTAATSITPTTATAGGNVTSGGTSEVTARGVCWSASANPTIAGLHTTDGSGTGTFTSSLTGLSPGATYHIRAYATNTSGTAYGNDLTFTTSCGTITSFPWSEGFENGGAIPICWTQEQVNSSGLNWTFVTGNGASNPATAHGGTYNACLKDVTTADNKTRLITPPLNLAGVSNPTLTFWHTQALRSTRQDQLEIYYKTSAGGTWTMIQSYTTSVTSWTQRTLTLPNPSGDYYIAFQGNAKYGYGVCVDDVQVSCTTSPVSVSIAPSANPVCAGTEVTFTATPTNGGTAPSYQWKVNGSNTGSDAATLNYIPAQGDLVTCVLTSNASCITGNPAVSNEVTMTVNPLLPVGVSITASANPVEEGTSVTFSAEPVNGGGTPFYQWKVNGFDVGSNEASFTYVPSDGDQVSCVLTSSGACLTGNPATSNTVVMVVNTVPQTVGLQNITVTGTQCFNAQGTIEVAGNETTFTVLNGGSATMLAGEKIIYHPGTMVMTGGEMFGYILPSGPWCNQQPDAPALTGQMETARQQQESFYKIYPNPTTGLLSLEIMEIGLSEKIKVELYGIDGSKIFSMEVSGKRIHEISLNRFPAGMYMVRILAGTLYGTERVIKTE